MSILSEKCAFEGTSIAKKTTFFDFLAILVAEKVVLLY